MREMDRIKRYTEFIGVKLRPEIKEWIPLPQSENIRIILEWIYESYPDINELFEVMKK